VRVLPSGRAGQALIFVIMVVVILAFVVLWNFDLHKILYVKFVSQNAGDAAAVAAARWQATTLNLIGDLNVLQAVALTGGDAAGAEAIQELQARLCFVGPVVGLLAAQQAAKNNGVFENPAFTARLRQHATTVATEYPGMTDGSGAILFPEPYPDAWAEYADMLTMVAGNGVAAGPDNARLYTDYSGGHPLLDRDFYDAVAGREWCWFYRHAPDLLEEYSDFRWWPPLPPRLPQTAPINSEFFGLGLARVAVIGSVPTVRLADQLRAERGLSGIPIADEIAAATSVWYVYDAGAWSSWAAFSATNTDFPAAGSLKPQYDYGGADAAVRVEAQAGRLTPGSHSNTITWTAAAKPFGYLEDGPERPNACGLVLPAYRDVRLIPVDASSAPAAGAFDLRWRDHIENHLPVYLEQGPPGGDPACWYCQQLTLWEDPLFRLSGVEWLRENSDTCLERGGPGGGGAGGGTRRGH
jgi:hypothetical protein